MGEAIVFTSGKGGVGKTTVISNIGVELSRLDKKVIMLDTDMGLRNLDLVMGIEDKVNYNLLDVLSNKCRIKQAIVRNRKYPNLHLIPAALHMDGLLQYEAGLKILVEELKAHFDYCLIDGPAGIDSGFFFSIAPADSAIVVTTPHISAIHDAGRCMEILDSKHFRSVSVVVNAYDERMVRKHQMISSDDIANILSANVMGTIPLDKNIIVCQNRGVPICEMHTKSRRVFSILSRQMLNNLSDGCEAEVI